MFPKSKVGCASFEGPDPPQRRIHGDVVVGEHDARVFALCHRLHCHSGDPPLFFVALAPHTCEYFFDFMFGQRLWVQRKTHCHLLTAQQSCCLITNDQQRKLTIENNRTPNQSARIVSTLLPKSRNEITCSRQKTKIPTFLSPSTDSNIIHASYGSDSATDKSPKQAATNCCSTAVRRLFDDEQNNCCEVLLSSAIWSLVALVSFRNFKF